VTRIYPRVLMSILFVSRTLAANPFLEAPNDRPASAVFRGTEWSDETTGGRDVPLQAHVITSRIAKTSWGAIFKIEFVDLASKAKKPRKIRREYFIVTDDRIALLNEEDNDAAAKKIAAMEKPPEFQPGDIYGITNGTFKHEDAPWTTTIELRGDECVFLSEHESSGHFKKVVWKKGVGLVEYAMGYGARADGFRLKRQK
jgi:hypothetical protein